MMENVEEVKQEVQNEADEVQQQLEQYAQEAKDVVEGLTEEEIMAKLQAMQPNLLPEGLSQEDILKGVSTALQIGQSIGDQALDMIKDSRWEDLVQYVNINGVQLSVDDIYALRDLGDVASDIASIAKDNAKTFTTAYAKAMQSDNFSETFMLGIIEGLIEMAKSTDVNADACASLISYLVGGNTDVVTLLREKSADAIVNLMVKFLTSKLDPAGGKFGFDPVTSYVLSILVNMLPEGGMRSNLLVSLAALMEEWRMLQIGSADIPEIATFVYDWLARAINELSGEQVVSTVAGAQVAVIDGINWFIFPFASGMIAIAGQPVAGPDVRIVWNKWSQTTKAALAWTSLIPLAGDTIVQLANAGAAQQTFSVLMDNIKSLKGAEDDLKSYFKFLGAQVIKYGANKLAKYIRQHAAEIKQRIADTKAGIKERLQNAFSGIQTVKASSEPSTSLSSVDESTPINDMQAVDDLASQFLGDEGDLVALAGEQEVYEQPRGIEQWYSGRRPVNPGSRYRV